MKRARASTTAVTRRRCRTAASKSVTTTRQSTPRRETRSFEASTPSATTSVTIRPRWRIITTPKRSIGTRACDAADQRIYTLATLGRTNGVHFGHVEGHPSFWAISAGSGFITAATSCTRTSTPSPRARRCRITIRCGRSSTPGMRHQKVRTSHDSRRRSRKRTRIVSRPKVARASCTRISATAPSRGGRCTREIQATHDETEPQERLVRACHRRCSTTSDVIRPERAAISDEERQVARTPLALEKMFRGTS